MALSTLCGKIMIVMGFHNERCEVVVTSMLLLVVPRCHAVITIVVSVDNGHGKISPRLLKAVVKL